MTRCLSAAAETVLGLVLAATPVALWIAWEPEILVAVLATTLASALLLVLVHRRIAPQSDVHTQHPELRDEFFIEMHRVFPLVHHHRRKQSARFARTMQRARRLVP